MPRIHLCSDGRDDAVTVNGEVDPYTAPDLSRFIAETCHVGASIHLDLGGVTFTDCALLRVLQTERRSRAPYGGTVHVLKASEPVHRLLSIVGEELVLGRRTQAHIAGRFTRGDGAASHRSPDRDHTGLRLIAATLVPPT